MNQPMIENPYAAPQAPPPWDPKLHRAVRCFVLFFAARLIVPNLIGFAAPFAARAFVQREEVPLFIRVVLRGNAVLNAAGTAAAAVCLFALTSRTTEIPRPLRLAARILFLVETAGAWVLAVEGLFHLTQPHREWATLGSWITSVLGTSTILVLVRQMASRRALRGRKHLATVCLIALVLSTGLSVVSAEETLVLVAINAALSLITWLGILAAVALMPSTPALAQPR